MVNVRGQDVLLPTTIVGSYPRPQFLHGKVFQIGGVDSPEFPDFETRALYRNAVALAIKDMTDAGLDIVTDGCQHYEMESDYEQGEIFHYYLDRLEGFVPYGDRITAGEFDNLPIYKPSCVGPIGWHRPIFKPMVEAVVEQTDKPNKIQAAVGPATMAALITDKHYGDIKALANDLARALNIELKDMVARGAEMVQFAEVLTFFDPADWVIEAVVAAAPGFGLVATVNDGDPSGTRPLSRALGERLVRLRLGYQRAEEERSILRQHAPSAPAWLVSAGVAISRASREHPDLVRGASVRGSIDLLLVARQLAALEDVDLRERGPRALDVVLRAALVAVSGRVTVRESSGRSAEDVIREVWENELVVRAAVSVGPTSTVALPSAVVRRPARPARAPGEQPVADGMIEPVEGAESVELGAGPQPGGAGELSRPAAADSAGSAADSGAPLTGTALTELELDDLTDLAADSGRRAVRRRQRRRLAGTDPRLVHALAVQIIMRRARQATRGRRGSGQLRAARYRFQSDDLDMDRSLEGIAANPYPSHEDFWVQERSPGRRGIVLMLDVSGSMRGAPLIRAALAAASAAAAALQDDLATVVFWSQVVVLTSVQNPRPVIRIVEDVLAVRSEGLTDISLGLATGLHQLEGSRAKDKLGILLTDGVSNHGGDPVTIARRFPQLHVLATATTPARLQACQRLASGRGECLPVERIADIPQALTRCLDS